MKKRKELMEKITRMLEDMDESDLKIVTVFLEQIKGGNAHDGAWNR